MALSVVIALVVIVALGLVGFLRRRRRARELLDWAMREGWTFVGSDPSVRAIGCGPAEHGATERHVLRGTARDGRPVTAFESRYTVRRSGTPDADGGGGGDTTSTVVHAVVATAVSPSVPGGHPMVQVSPYRGVRFLRGLGRDRRAVVTGRRDFDDRFDLLTEHPGWAAVTVGSDVVAWLVSDPRMRSTSFRLHGDGIVLWRRGDLTPPTLESMLDLASELRTRLGQDGARLAA